VNPLIKTMLAAVNGGEPSAAIAHRFGVRAVDIDDLRGWPTDRREAVIEWLLRD
jgi:hypothetical protein